MRRSIGIAAVVLAAVLAACSNPAPPAASGPSRENGPSRETGPSGPTGPMPTSQRDVIVATVTADSAGPCYLVETDEGHSYALYGSGGRVARGQRVQVQIAPLTASVECGPGQRALIVKLIS